MTDTVPVRHLASHASQVVREVPETGKATFITSHGRPVAAIAPVGIDDLLDHVLATEPQYLASMRDADEDLAVGHTRSLADTLDEMERAREHRPTA